MKTGKSLTALVEEIERQAKSKRDFEADTRRLTMLQSGRLAMNLEGGENRREPSMTFSEVENSFHVTPHCHGQIASRLKIPKDYYDRMQAEEPGLLANNVNTWFKRKPEMRMIRTLDGKARAFLSDRYRPLDYFDMMGAVLPEVIHQPDIKIVSAEVTETKLYLKLLFPKLEGEVALNDPVQAGLVISNSEIGCGSVRIEPLIYRLVCLNGMITQAAMRKYHIGKKGDEEAGVRELLTDETKTKTDEAFWMQVRDVIRGSLTEDIFQGNVQRLRDAKGQKIEGDPMAVVELTQKKFGFNEIEKAGVLRNLIEGADLSAYGLANAVTRTSQDVEDYDRATEMERDGGRIIELSQKDWSELSRAA